MFSYSNIVRLCLVVPLLVFGGCRHSYEVSKHSAQTYTVSSGVGKNELSALIEPYKSELVEKMSEKIGETDTTLTKMQPESTLGNFMADAQLQAARKIDQAVDIAIANYGGIRISYLSKGDIKIGNMYELMPFDNLLTILEMPGSMLHRLCDHMASYGGWPVAGMNYKIRNKQAVDILVGGKQLNEHGSYKVAISDYVANGGDKCDFLKTATQHNTDILIRDVLIDYVKGLTAENKPLHVSLENRVQYAE